MNNIHKQHRLRRVLYIFFLISCFFPSVSLIRTGLDSQPYAFCLGVIICIIHFNTRKFPKILLPLFLLSILSIIVFFIYADVSYYGIRSLYIYFSIFIITSAAYFVLTSALLRYREIIKLVVIVIAIYAIVGIVQTVFYPTFLSFLVSRGQNLLSYGRGVSSLAPEPTTFAYYCISLLIITLHYPLSKKNTLVIFIIILSQIVFLGRSSGGIVVIFTAVALYLLTKAILQKKILAISVSLLFIVLSFYLIPKTLVLLPVSRMKTILESFSQDPIKTILMDESINERVLHIVLPIYASMNRLFIPYGYNQFGNLVPDFKVDKNVSWLINDWFYSVSGDKGIIMSGIGSIIFELGLLGVLLLFYPLFISGVVNEAKINGKMLFALILFITLTFNSISFGSPIVCLVFASFLAHGKNSRSFKSYITIDSSELNHNF